MTQKAYIKIKSTVEGTEIFNEYDGEYKFENGAHHFVYTDYTGNAVTKNALRFDDCQPKGFLNFLLHYIAQQRLRFTAYRERKPLR